MLQVRAAEKKEIMMWESLREATDEEMERDATVCVMGKLLSDSVDQGQDQRYWDHQLHAKANTIQQEARATS